MCDNLDGLKHAYKIALERNAELICSGEEQSSSVKEPINHTLTHCKSPNLQINLFDNRNKYTIPFNYVYFFLTLIKRKSNLIPLDYETIIVLDHAAVALRFMQR